MDIFTERLWRTVKYEEVYLHDYASPREARQGLTTFFQFYNDERPHQALDYRTPAEIYYGTIASDHTSKTILPSVGSKLNQKGSTLTQATFVS